MGAGQLAALVLAGMFVLLCGVGISGFSCLTVATASRPLELQNKDAQRQEQEAKRINDANQAADPMNRLTSVAEGDLAWKPPAAKTLLALLGELDPLR